LSAWYPQREVEIIAGTPPGGGLDRSARALAKAIEARRLMDVPVKVANVVGDGSRNAWRYLDGFPGDPHRIAVSSSNFATDHLLGTTAFRHESDFTPLAILYTEYIAFVARADSAIGSAAGLVQRLARDAASVTVALSTSLGNPNHIALAQVARHAGARVTAPKVRVFDSALDAVADVAAGNADVAAVTAASPAQELAAGTMRALAVSSPRRLAGLYAGTPTWREQSVECVIGAWRGASGARGLTPEQVDFWERTLAAAVAASEWKDDLARHYWTSTYLDGASLRGHLQRERADMALILGELGLLPPAARADGKR
jgi:putative tricarboxylic transport membrane protein